MTYTPYITNVGAWEKHFSNITSNSPPDDKNFYEVSSNQSGKGPVEMVCSNQAMLKSRSGIIKRKRSVSRAKKNNKKRRTKSKTAQSVKNHPRKRKSRKKLTPPLKNKKKSVKKNRSKKKNNKKKSK